MKSKKHNASLVLKWALMPLFLYAIACKKEATSSPTGPPVVSNPPPPASNPAPQTMCHDTICGLPFKLNPTFMPSGFYTNAEPTVVFKMDTCPGTSGSTAAQCLKIAYTFNGGYWGAGFLNNNSWSPNFKIVNTVKKITFSVYYNNTFNVTFIPFGSETYGPKFELYPSSTDPASPYKWINVSLYVNTVPASFAMCMGIVMDGVKFPKGSVNTIYIKDLQFE